MSIAKYFKDNKEAYEVMNDPKSLCYLLLILQEATDHYMNDVRKKLSDKRRTVQQKAEDALKIAQAIIAAEKRARELELYNTHKVISRGMSVITDI